jgi:hypothetical protein
VEASIHTLSGRYIASCYIHSRRIVNFVIKKQLLIVLCCLNKQGGYSIIGFDEMNNTRECKMRLLVLAVLLSAVVSCPSEAKRMNIYGEILVTNITPESGAM